MARRRSRRHPRHQPTSSHPRATIARLRAPDQPRRGRAGAAAADRESDMGSLKYAVAVLAATLAIAPSAHAQTRSITYAARSCPSYADVTANLARNNIQESLQDLGDDTDYVSGEPISPAIEEPGQPNCRPIVGWRFLLGDGISGSPSVGPWGSLSQVSDPDSTSIVTEASVPLRNDNGDVTGGRVAGAVTVNLTDAQVNRAASHALWV